jgi:hypothetical protein
MLSRADQSNYFRSFVFSETTLTRSTFTAEGKSLDGAGISFRLERAFMVRLLPRPMKEMVNRLEVVTGRQVLARIERRSCGLDRWTETGGLLMRRT